MANVTRRKDSNNRVLKENESQRKDGIYMYRWRDGSGTRHAIYAPTLTELREKEKTVLKDALDGIRPDIKNATINDMFDLWVQLKRGLKDNTFANYRYMYEHYVMPEFGKRKLSGLKKPDIRAYYIDLIEGKGLNISTADGIHTVLHQVLQLAVESNYIRTNPSDNAMLELKKAYNSGVEKRKAMTALQQETFENYLANNARAKQWQPIFTVMLWTGMRAGEISGLQWADVDFESGIIRVRHNLVYYEKEGKCRYAMNTTKTKAGEREIPMLPCVEKALNDEKARQKELGINCNSDVDGYSDFVFLNRFGEHFGVSTLNKALKRVVRDCNLEILDKGESDMEDRLIPPVSNHILRHSFTTRLVERGVNVKALQTVLGHKDVKTTLQIYADCSQDFLRAELRRAVDKGQKDNTD